MAALRDLTPGVPAPVETDEQRHISASCASLQSLTRLREDIRRWRSSSTQPVDTTCVTCGKELDGDDLELATDPELCPDCEEDEYQRWKQERDPLGPEIVDDPHRLGAELERQDAGKDPLDHAARRFLGTATPDDLELLRKYWAVVVMKDDYPQLAQDRNRLPRRQGCRPRPQPRRRRETTRTPRRTRAGPDEDGDPEPAGAGDPAGVETSRSSLAGGSS